MVGVEYALFVVWERAFCLPFNLSFGQATILSFAPTLLCPAAPFS
jgi:hypothetical protein